jgi:type IV pilus assembly protein PilE
MKFLHGFTLIELLIAVAIIAILAAVAVPNYTNYVTRGKVQEATSGLANGRIRMEQCFQDRRTYDGCTAPNATDNFTFAASNLGLTTFTLTATGKGGLSAYTYTINESNVRSSNTPWGNNTSCWVIKSGGLCQ